MSSCRRDRYAFKAWLTLWPVDMGVASESGTLRRMVFDVAPGQTAGGTRSYLRTDLLGAAFALFAGITLGQCTRFERHHTPAR